MFATLALVGCGSDQQASGDRNAPKSAGGAVIPAAGEGAIAIYSADVTPILCRYAQDIAKRTQLIAQDSSNAGGPIDASAPESAQAQYAGALALYASYQRSSSSESQCSNARLEKIGPEEAAERRARGPDWDPGSHRRLRLAEAIEAQRPEQALPSYMLVADEMLLETGAAESTPRPSRCSSTPVAPPTRPARASGSRPASRISANITAAAPPSSRCSTRPASDNKPTELAPT